MKKKVLSIFAVILIALSCFTPTNVFASETPIDEYINFEVPTSRISSNGNFTFNVHRSLKSGSFTANGTSITIQTRARIYHLGYDTYRTSKNVKFQVVLYKSGGTRVGSYTGMADNIYGGKEFTGLKKGATYYFEILVLDEDIQHSAVESIKGSGNVSGATIK